MKAARRKLFDLTGQQLFARFQKPFERKSPEEAERSGEKLGLLLYALDRKHRNRTDSNLALAFPEMRPEDRKVLGKQVFRHFGRICGDFLRSPVRTMDEVRESTEIESEEYLAECEAIGKGVLIVTAHLGNWERAGHRIVSTGRDLSVVARDADQEGVQAQVLKMRESTGISVLSRGNSARQILTKLRKNGLVALLSDQNSFDTFVPFFGHPCGTVSGPAVLHQRTGAPILPAYCIWLDYSRYKVIFLPPIDPANVEPSVDAITTEINQALEDVIRRFPSQWLWMHDRWKSARREGLLE